MKKIIVKTQEIYMLKRMIASLAMTVALLLPATTIIAGELPKGFVYLDDMIPDVQIDLRYYGQNNFLGQPVDGYKQKKCIISKQAAVALKKVQDDLKRFGLGIKVFDAYRPQQAVDHFVRWAKDIKDTKMKHIFYPDVAKKDLFKLDYIARRSSHTRGSTVDLTLISIIGKNKGQELDMGSCFDFFGKLSWPTNQSIQPQQRANRMLLQTLMVKHGFTPYHCEWWHFTLKNEPFPETYFDFPIQ
jgi:D-alanyl-D-alanine dipeptidase